MDTYRATNTKNGKFYIGSTFNFDRRKAEHFRCAENYPFQNALRKNPEAFEWEVWQDDSNDSVLEQALLDMWFGCEQCYNLNPSAKHPPRADGIPRTQATKDKISESMKSHWDGNEEKREEWRDRKIGTKQTQEAKDKAGDSLSLNWGNRWEVVDSDGNLHIVTNLRRFCKEHSLNRSCMHDLVKKQNGQKTHRGFKLKDS